MLCHSVCSLASDLRNVLREFLYRVRQPDLRSSSLRAFLIGLVRIFGSSEADRDLNDSAHRREALLSENADDGK